MLLPPTKTPLVETPASVDNGATTIVSKVVKGSADVCTAAAVVVGVVVDVSTPSSSRSAAVSMPTPAAALQASGCVTAPGSCCAQGTSRVPHLPTAAPSDDATGTADEEVARASFEGEVSEDNSAKLAEDVGSATPKFGHFVKTANCWSIFGPAPSSRSAAVGAFSMKSPLILVAFAAISLEAFVVILAAGASPLPQPIIPTAEALLCLAVLHGS